MSRADLSAAEIEALFARLAAANPAPKTELVYRDPYTLLVAVVLSAQATDVSVNRATPALFAQAATPEAMVALGEARLAEFIRTIGLYKTKAKNIIALSRRLIERHGGKVPDDRAALEALPGVGRKTASVVLNAAFGHAVIAVDTHVFRVANRTGLARGQTPDRVADLLEKRVPPAYRQHAHHWLILHGRYLCTARQPRCPECPIAEWCRYPEKTSAGTEIAVKPPGGAKRPRSRNRGSPRGRR